MDTCFYRVLIFIIGLCLIEGIVDEIHFQKFPIVKDVQPRKLSMDEAYLILSNINNSNTSVFLGNPLSCEACNLEKMAEVFPHSNITLIISTKFAYDLEVRSLSSNELFLCDLKSYKFAEHGTYILEVTVGPENGTNACLIVQIEESSNYWSPIIIGIVVWIVFIAIVQIIYHVYRRGYLNKIIAKVSNQQLIKDNYETMPLTEPLALSKNLRQTEHNSSQDEANDETLPLIQSNHLSNKTTNCNSVTSKRFQALDSFRGLALMLMIFVGYGGGGYWFFDHAIWNGLNLADTLFPWFVWLIGFSIVLSQKSLRAKNIQKRSILLKICRRTAILFLLGLMGNDGKPRLETLKILDVLQRLALCYFFTAIIVLFIPGTTDELNTTRSTNGNKMNRHWGIDLMNSVFRFWLQWLCILLIVVAWLLITFFLNVPNCPKGYLGPGGKHEHGKYQNCTGGAARYFDQLILTDAHMGQCWTCGGVYNTQLSFNPEGSLGVLTGILLCYLGVQAAHSYIHSTNVRRVCIHWFISAIICGSLGLLLSKGGHSNGWIPINKNLWSLSYVLVVASLAFIILIIFYLLIDTHQWMTGAPFIWLGMNSIFIYLAQAFLKDKFPISFRVEETHAKTMAINLYSVFFWTIIAGLMYWKKTFVVI